MRRSPIARRCLPGVPGSGSGLVGVWPEARDAPGAAPPALAGDAEVVRFLFIEEEGI